MGYIGMCRAKGYGFAAALVINRVSILAILVINRYQYLHSSLELLLFFFLKKLLLHHDVYSNCVRAATACHALRSRLDSKGF